MDIQIGSNAIYTTTTPSLNYKIVVGGVTIYRGRALSAPNGKISINVSQIVEDYLNSDEFPKRNINPILYSEAGGYIQTYLYRVGEEGSDTLLAQYNFLRSYDSDWEAGVYDSRQEVWTGQSITMSNPVNGRMDPRMQFLYTVYRKTSGETISWGIVPKFRIVPDRINASPDGGTYSIMIESNVPFTASTDIGWITISGSEPNFTVTVSSNSGESRNGGVVLTFLDENDNQQTLTIPVVQQNLNVNIIPSSIEFGPDGGESRFTVFSNVEATPTTSADWLTFESVRTGDGFVTYKIVAASNRESTSGRTATVSVMDASITVTQDAFTVTVTPSSMTIPSTGGTYSFTVYSDVDYTLHQLVGDGDWITLSATGGTAGINTFTFTADTTTSQFERIGYVRVFDTRMLTVIQEAAVISVSPSAVTLPIEGSSSQLTITSNVDYSISASAEWLTLSSTGGTAGTTVLTISAPANTAETRTAEITVGYQTVTVKQKGDIIISPTSANFDYNSGTTTVTIISDDDYSISTEDDWITLSATGGTSGTTVLQITVNENDFNDRTGTVTIGGKTFTITQEGANPAEYLSLDIVSGGTLDYFTINSDYTQPISYSKDDGATWTAISAKTDGSYIAVSVGDKVLLKGTNNAYSFYQGAKRQATNLRGTAKFNLSGNILSLIYGDNFEGQTTVPSEYQFYGFFRDSGVVNASGLTLPSVVTYGCYMSMFSGCTSLTSAPELPATTLENNCYQHMFEGCTSLTSAPELPATTLAYMCYHQMFYDCISLTSAPELPATTLANSCYHTMFGNCTSLTSAPELPATTLAQYCYDHMFYHCASLTSAPELPATTLKHYCYWYMFSGCASLNYIKCLATDISAYNCTTDWVYNVASSGTFVKAASMNSWLRGDKGIPTGWTVINE